MVESLLVCWGKPTICLWISLTLLLFQALAAALQLLHHRGGQRGVPQEEESQPGTTGLESHLQEIIWNIFGFQIFFNLVFALDIYFLLEYVITKLCWYWIWIWSQQLVNKIIIQSWWNVDLSQPGTFSVHQHSVNPRELLCGPTSPRPDIPPIGVFGGRVGHDPTAILRNVD